MKKSLPIILSVLVIICFGTVIYFSGLGQNNIDNTENITSEYSIETNNNAIQNEEIESSKIDNAQEIRPSTMEYTNAVPSAYFNKAEKQGKVEKVEYETYDYTNKSATKITKPAYVYLPYGYDKNDTNTKYNVFFFMHGWTGTAEEYLYFNNSAVTNILDNMIENNLIEPTIVVSLTFDTENKSQDFSRSTREIAVYNQEFRNDLLPFIDENYNTYGTREHRAFGGFSLGAVTTWYQFEHNLDLIKYFIPMSGDSWTIQMYGGRSEPEKTANKLKEIANNSEYDFYICQTNGTNDSVFSQPDNQMKAMFKLTDTFNNSNLIYLMKEGGYHNMNAVAECTYNGLQRILK